MKRMNRAVWAMLGWMLCLSVGGAYGQETKGELLPAPEADFPLLRCPKLAAAPVIDGKLDDKAWLGAIKLDRLPAHPYMHEKACQTEVYLGHDETALYAAFRCREPSPRMGWITKMDVAEFFLDVNPSQSSGCHLIFDPEGGVFTQTLKAAGWENGFAGKFAYKVVKEGHGWTVELALPFASLGVKPDGALWRANFCRQRICGGADEYASWMPSRGWLNISQMGFLRCGPEAAFVFHPREPLALHTGANAIDGTIRATGPGTVILRAFAWEGTQVFAAASTEAAFVEAGEKAAVVTLDVPSLNKGYLAQELVDAKTGAVVYRLPARPIRTSGTIRVDGLLPAYYNDDDVAAFHVRFQDDPDLLSDPRPGYGLGMVFRPIRVVNGMEKNAMPPEGKRCWVTFFPRDSTLFHEAGYSGFFPIRGLPEGVYGLKVALVGAPQRIPDKEQAQAARASGRYWENIGCFFPIMEALPEQTCEIIPPPTWKPEPIKKVAIGPQGEIRINGKPFLPLSCYAEPNPVVPRYGFNISHVSTIKWASEDQAREALQQAEGAGTYLHLPLGDWGVSPKDRLAKCRIAEKTPYVLFYEGSDEVLGWFAQRTERIPWEKESYEEIRKTDPAGRLCYAVTTASPTLYAWGAEVFEKYLTWCDILAPDVYAMGNMPLTAIYDAAKKTADVARKLGKTFVFVPQGNALYHYRWPDADELRAQAFMAILGGAKGIYWYTFGSGGDEQGLISNPAAWAAMKKLNRDLLDLTETLAVPDAGAGLQVTPSFGMRTRHAVVGKKNYIFVANGSYVPKRVKIMLPGLAAGARLDVHGEYRSLFSQQDGWEEDFAPLAVHVYIFER